MKSMNDKKARRNEKHKRYQKLLNSRKWWGEVRVNQLRAHPLCQMCEQEGIVTAAIDVHHIRPVMSVPDEEMEELCYSANNLISLCREHHIQVHRDMGSRHDLKPAPKGESLRSFVSKWAGTSELAHMDNMGDLYRTRNLPRFLKTKDQKLEADRASLEAWKNQMSKRFGG